MREHDMTPDDRKYAETHEWVKVDGDTAVVGITDYAQQQLGDVTFVELPDPGKRMEQGGECAVIESVKAASDVYAPVSGEIAGANATLEEKPESLNEDPYEGGWIFKLKDFDAGQLEGLMDAAAYESTLEE